MANSFPADTSKYKLIVSDFDGTLAGKDHITTPKVTEAVKKWVASGKHFSIATGRQFLMIQDECKKLGLTDPVIVRGGAEVIDPAMGSILHSEYISLELVPKIREIVDKSNIFNYSIDVDDSIYTNFEFRYKHVFPKIKFKDLSEFTLRDIAKFHLKPKDDTDPKNEEVVKQIELTFPEIHVVATHNSFGKGWDITSVRATKLYGIVKLMEILDITKEEIVGAGDSYNDFPLLEAAGLKVAMGNGIDEIKAIADIEVTSNVDDGMAELIDKLLQS